MTRGSCFLRKSTHEIIIILDFGSQYTQLIARRVREAGVYCEILPFNTSTTAIRERMPKGIILSGGPSSVYDEGAPGLTTDLIGEGSPPVLGICYGLQLIAQRLGGFVEPAASREYGYARLQVTDPASRLFLGLPREMDVWMSHGDNVTLLPEDFIVIARTEGAINAFENPSRNIYGLQFHPEVAHTPRGGEIISNFLFTICHAVADWTPGAFIEGELRKIRAQVHVLRLDGAGRATFSLKFAVARVTGRRRQQLKSRSSASERRWAKTVVRSAGCPAALTPRWRLRWCIAPLVIAKLASSSITVCYAKVSSNLRWHCCVRKLN